METPHGRVFSTRTETPLGARYGRSEVSLEPLLSPIPPTMARVARDARAEGVSLSRFLYLDTETTGLATTSGTFAFLIGIGFVDGTLFIVEQYFARDYDEEPALLWALAERMRGFDGIVTYNGRAFDIPLLQARFATNRSFDPPIPNLHLDMLYPARQLWRARRVGCSLGSLERDVLGVGRELDVPGAMIPGIYLTALRTGDTSALRPVFEHNVHDILSMAGLTACAVRLLGREVAKSSTAEDVLSLARIVERENALDAVGLYTAATEGEFRSEVSREESLCRLGVLHRRLGNRDEAVRTFSRIATEGSVFRPFALVELAKHLEHAEREFEEAVRMARRAREAVLNLETRGMEPSAEFRVTAEEIDHRLARLSARAVGAPWRRS